MLLTEADDLRSLMVVFDFSDADLQANRAGHMTDSQCETLKRDGQRRLIALGFFTALAVFVLLATYPKPPSNDYFVFIIMLIVFVGAAWALFSMYRELQADITSGAVDMTAGRPHLHIGRMRSSRGYWILINGQSFKLTEAKYRALELYLLRAKGNPQLRVYFTLQAHEVLSVEVIE